jgi:hypothetical protein
MRICEQCGTANGDDAEFCGGCGAFLEWDAREDAARAERAAGAVAADPSPATIRSPATDPPVTTGPPLTTGPPVTTGSAGTAPADATGTTRTGPAPVQPGQRTPHRVRHTPTVMDEPTRVAPGETACPACGVGNDPTRRFCRRCGTPLAGVAVARLPWWRRLLARLRGRRAHAAGYRPRTRTRFRGGPWTVLVFLLAAVVAVALIPSLRGLVGAGVTAVRDRLANREQVTPVNATASSSADGHPAKNLYDAATNVYWAPSVPSTGAVGQWVALDLARPVRLLDLVFTTGISADRQQFLTEARPEHVEVTLTAADGTTRVRSLRLHDAAGAQRFDVTGDGVTRIQVTIRSIYGARPGRQVAIAEVEVFVRG